MRTGVGAGGATGDLGDEYPRDPGLPASPFPRALSGEKRPVVPGVPAASARTTILSESEPFDSFRSGNVIQWSVFK